MVHAFLAKLHCAVLCYGAGHWRGPSKVLGSPGGKTHLVLQEQGETRGARLCHSEPAQLHKEQFAQQSWATAPTWCPNIHCLSCNKQSMQQGRRASCLCAVTLPVGKQCFGVGHTYQAVTFTVLLVRKPWWGYSKHTTFLADRCSYSVCQGTKQHTFAEKTWQCAPCVHVRVC